MAQAIIPLVSLGLGLWTSSQMAKSSKSQYENLVAQMQSAQTANLAEMPSTPVNPTLEENTEAEDAAAKVQAAAAAAQEQYNPTGGLGITGSSLGKKQTLAGV